jgi:hypothetical protein
MRRHVVISRNGKNTYAISTVLYFNFWIEVEARTDVDHPATKSRDIYTTGTRGDTNVIFSGEIFGSSPASLNLLKNGAR